MDVIILGNILKGIIALANIYLLFMFAMAIMNLLGIFGVINIYDGPLAGAYRVLRMIIDPALIFLNRFIPRFGMIDLSFLALVIILWIIVDVCQYLLEGLYASSFSF